MGKQEYSIKILFTNKCTLLLKIFSLSWCDSPLVGLGLLLIHEDFCGF
jgi:hypothetical protein